MNPDKSVNPEKADHRPVYGEYTILSFILGLAIVMLTLWTIVIITLD
jgi:hypothetical protein